MNFAHGDVATYFLIMATPPGKFNTHARGSSIYKNCASSSANGKKKMLEKLIGKKYARKTGSYFVAAAALLPTFQSNNNNNFFSLPLKWLFRSINCLCFIITGSPITDDSENVAKVDENDT